MPKTVPKSTKNNDLAESRQHYHHQRQQPDGGGGERSKVKRRYSELEPNGSEEDSGEPSKRPNRTDPDQRVNQVREDATTGQSSSPDSPGSSGSGSDFLLQALQRIHQLQDEIDFLENDPYAEDADSSENDDDDDDDVYPIDGAVTAGHQAEALGFAVCARETMAFLEREGVPADSAMMVSLKSLLIGRCEQNLSC